MGRLFGTDGVRGVFGRDLTTDLALTEDPSGLAAAIERLAGDTALRARIGAGGRALAAQFSWDVIAERHEALYHQLLAAGVGQAPN